MKSQGMVVSRELTRLYKTDTRLPSVQRHLKYIEKHHGFQISQHVNYEL